MMPCSIFRCHKTDTLEMYAMLEKKKNIPFSQEILLMYFYELSNKMQVNVFGIFMKIMCVFFLCSNVMLMDNDPGRLPDILIGGQFGASCLRHLEFLHRARSISANL